VLSKLVVSEKLEAAGLAGQQVIVGLIGRRCMADGHAAGLMIARNDNQGILGMLFVKCNSRGNTVIEVEHIADGGNGVIGMAGPVYLAAFDHKEKAFFIPLPFISQTGDSNLGHFSQ